MSFTLDMKENEINNWTVVVCGYSEDNTKSYHFKKIKYKGSFEDSVKNAIKILKLDNENYKIGKVETLQDKLNEIEFNRQPIPKLYNRLIDSEIDADFILNKESMIIEFKFDLAYLVDDPDVVYFWGGSISSERKLRFITYVKNRITQVFSELKNVKLIESINSGKPAHIRKLQDDITLIVHGNWKNL